MLSIIKDKRDISDIFQIGIGVSQLPAILQEIENEGLCSSKTGEYILSQAGEDLLHEHGSPFTNHDKKVTPCFERRLPRISTNAVYMPTVSPDL